MGSVVFRNMLVFPSPSSAHAHLPHPSGQEQPPRQPSLHSTPALTSPPSSVGLGGGVSARQPPGGLEMSEGQVPQSQPASLHARPAARQRQKESEEGRQVQPGSLQGRASPSPKPKRSKASGNGAKLDVIVSCIVAVRRRGGEGSGVCESNCVKELSHIAIK